MSMPTGENAGESSPPNLPLELPPADVSAEEVLTWAAVRFMPRLALSCSFGGPGGMVLAHMAATCAPEIPLLFIDTGFLFPETLQLRRTFAERYGLKVLEYSSPLTTAEQAVQHGEKLWEQNPDACCQIRKVEPMARALEDLSAWITALRRDQSQTRSGVHVVEEHTTGTGRIVYKINPLAHWTREEVWNYITKHQVPYNPLLDQGYKSLGCIQCTVRVGAEDPERAGRWAGHAKTECGLHTFTRQLPLENDRNGAV